MKGFISKKVQVIFAVLFCFVSIQDLHAQKKPLKNQTVFKVITLDKNSKTPISGAKISFVSFGGNLKGKTNFDGEAAKTFKKGATVAIAVTHKFYYGTTSKAFKLKKNKTLKIMLKSNGKGPPPSKTKKPGPTSTPGIQSTFASTPNPTPTITPTIAVPACKPGEVAGDGNVDCCVDQADYNLWKSNFGKSSPQVTDGDYNRDGSVDAADYTTWRNNLGHGCLNFQPPTPLPSQTPTASYTPSITPTRNPSHSVTPTFTPSKTPTATNTSTNTYTPSSTFTASPTSTRTPTPSSTPTNTSTPTKAPPPVILTHPVNKTLSAGGVASFNITVGPGAGTLQFQWQKNGIDIPDAVYNAYDYDIPSGYFGTGLEHFDYGATFRCGVSNDGGQTFVYSTPATLIINAGTRPGTTKSGVPSGFTVTANGFPNATDISIYMGATPSFNPVPVRLNWEAAASPYNTGYRIYAGTTTSIGDVPANQLYFDTTVSPNQLTDHFFSKTYTVKGIAAPGGLSAGSVSKTVRFNFIAQNAPNPLPFYSFTHPSSQVVPVGQYAALCVSANVPPEQNWTAPIGLQWRKNGVDIRDNTDAWTYCHYTNEPGFYDVVFSNRITSVVSNPAQLINQIVPTEFVLQPQTQNVAVGSAYKFIALVKGAGPFEYKWFRNGVQKTGTNTNLAIFTGTTLAADNGATYWVTVTTPSGVAESNHVQINTQ